MFVSLKDADNVSHHMQTDVLPSGEESQAVKLQLGDAGVDGGYASQQNPIPVELMGFFRRLFLVFGRFSFDTTSQLRTAVTGAVGGGCTIKWLPSFAPDKLFVVRGNGTSNIYTYYLVANTWATQTFNPSTETFTTASAHTARSVGGKGYSIISSKEATMRIYEYDPSLSRLHPKMNQWLYPTGAAVQGDRTACLRSPDEIEFYYLLLPSSTALLRCALLDS